MIYNVVKGNLFRIANRLKDRSLNDESKGPTLQEYIMHFLKYASLIKLILLKLLLCGISFGRSVTHA
jgi:hypothetical protein